MSNTITPSANILDSLLEVFKQQFQTLEMLKPRVVALEDFAYINDEETDKAEEEEIDFEICLRKELIPSHHALIPKCENRDVLSVDTASARLGKTDLAIGRATEDYPLIVDVSGLPIQAAGETKKFFLEP